MSYGSKKQDILFMQEALKEAQKAQILDEVPVGAVLVKNNQIISKAYNTKELSQNVICHAEIKVINQASKRLKNWRLLNCYLYVTLDPCVMCWGAIISSRISRLIYGASNAEQPLVLDTTAYLPYLSSKLSVTKGILKKECSEMLTTFFKEKRQQKKSSLERWVSG